eukprot:5296904-Amphidinium_carterae.1
MEQGTHWELGRWAHHLIPYEGGLHVFNVYGYSSDKDRAQELNREVCLEIFAAVAALGNRQIFILGDWNFGYRGQKSYEKAERTEAHEVEVEYGRARQGHLARWTRGWSAALAAQDVEQLWELWCRAAEQALGLPALSRGRLLQGNQQLLEKVPDEEAVATARQQDQ